ncbi:M1 family metallopeptidase [Gandjariella thermophila]|uniref:Aminopeptidase N n=1 Tax=Gandjariella thermophila TaxID=1931992 RepID=A0A4D4J8G8_9PSEU|nr:M1 family metallopeptidase [Gandjariella thermophila]GDY30796.1 peptidase [Gandjariella thermophila]
MNPTSAWRSVPLAVVTLACAALVTSSAVIPMTARAGSPVAGRDGAGDDYYPTDGNGGYLVADYQVAITYDPVSHHLAGDTVVSGRTTQRLNRFNLDLTGLDVHAVTVDGRPAAFARSGDHELVVTPPRPLESGTPVRVEVRYAGIPKQIPALLGVGGWQISAGGGAFAAGEPHSATSWYPANDTPRNKATFHLSATVPDGWSVVSNGREQGTTSSGGWTTFRWAEDTPIATYLTTVAIDHWTLERSRLADGTPVVDAYAPGAEDKRELETRLPEILDFLSSKFGPYPQDAAGGIFLADQIGFSLETQTRPTYAHWANLATIVHENTHQWFGDSVSVDGWRDTCLNECFASYAQWLWAEVKDHWDLDTAYRQYIARTRNNPSFWSGRLYDMGPGREFTSVYSKGILAMHALRRQIGESAFDAVLRGWPTLHRGGNASWPEFEAFLQQVSGQDLRGFLQAWFHDGMLPPEQYLYPGTLRQ